MKTARGFALASLAAAMFVAAAPAAADNFSFEFEWGDIPRCTTGNPNTVPNPTFNLSNVPDGTAYLKFAMRDLNAPSYNHGGGKVRYEGQSVVEPGAFRYRSPCPPSGTHRYRWTASAHDSERKELAKATSTQRYP